MITNERSTYQCLKKCIENSMEKKHMEKGVKSYKHEPVARQQ